MLIDVHKILNYLSYNSVVILSFFFISLAVYILNNITHGKSNRRIFSSERDHLLNPLTYIRLVTHIFGHENWENFMRNLMYILLIGPMIEEKYGSINLLVMLLITSLVIGLFNTIFSNYSITGASGNVYMLIVLSSFSNISEGKVPITLVLILIFYIISEFTSRVFEGNKKTYHTGHLLGALCGIGFGFYFLYFKTFPFIQYMIK